MTNERFRVTGATGCIGAWVIRNLVLQGLSPFALDIGDSRHRLELILNRDELARVNFIPGDITDLAAVRRVMDESNAAHVIHLAAMQLPFCKSNPPLGARVNVEGTVNIFEAAKRAGVKRVVYASSAAVYGAAEAHAKGPVAHDATLEPHSHYGVYKQANEGTAKVYWMDNAISSIGLRPHVVYGPGRDQGMTSAPTKAMLAAALGREYHISFGGTYQFQYADDVGKMLIQCCRVPFEGCDVFHVGGFPVSTQDVVAAIESIEPSIRGQITCEVSSLPFPAEFDNSALATLLGGLRETPLAQGVAQTIAAFKSALATGLITDEFLEHQLRS